MRIPESDHGRVASSGSFASIDDDLVARCLDGRGTDVDFRRLEARLASDPTFQRDWLDLATIDALLAQRFFQRPAAMTGADLVHGVMEKKFTPLTERPHARGLSQLRGGWRAAIAGTVGLLVGGLLVSAVWTSAVWAMVGNFAAPKVRILADGFESGRSPQVDGAPVRTGVWGGDYCDVVGPRNGVAPAAGARMLRFLRGDFAGKPLDEGFSCGTHRLVDLRPYRRQIDSGNAVVQIRALFNRESGAGEERDQCAVSVAALDAVTATDGSLRVAGELQKRALACAWCKHIDLDRDASTWQEGVTELRVPEQAEFLLVFFGVNRFPPRHGEGVAVFPGHYCDNVRVSLVERSMVP